MATVLRRQGAARAMVFPHLLQPCRKWMAGGSLLSTRWSWQFVHEPFWRYIYVPRAELIRRLKKASNGRMETQIGIPGMPITHNNTAFMIKLPVHFEIWIFSRLAWIVCLAPETQIHLHGDPRNPGNISQGFLQRQKTAAKRCCKVTVWMMKCYELTHNWVFLSICWLMAI